MKLFTWKNALRTAIWGGATLVVLAVAGFIAAAIYVVRVTDDLPDYQQLAQYEPPIMSRVHAGDGLLIAEFAREQRVFVAAPAPLAKRPGPAARRRAPRRLVAGGIAAVVPAVRGRFLLS